MSEKPKIFFIYSQKDIEIVDEIYLRLREEGYLPWMSAREIKPGERWESRIIFEIMKSDLVLVFLSKNNETKEGFFRDEIDLAIRRSKQVFENENRVFMIPIRLDESNVPNNLRTIQWIEYNTDDAWIKIRDAIDSTFIPRLVQSKPPMELINICRRGECIPFIGSGLSIRAGIPSWDNIVRKIIDYFIELDPTSNRTYETLSRAFEIGDLDFVVDLINRQSDNIDYESILLNELDNIHVEEDTPLSREYQFIHKIGSSGILTTNYDSLLEQNINYEIKTLTPSDTERLFEEYSRGNPFVLKLHGNFFQQDTLILSSYQFEKELTENRIFNEFLINLIQSRTFLFIGLSIESISEFFSALKPNGNNRKHFALVGVSSSVWETQAEILLHRYNVQVFPYPVNEPQHELLFLESISNQLDDRIDEYPISKLKMELARIESIKLENIGPFNELSLDLQDRWNILLGDNGVGKSSILRAIAFGLCGEMAKQYANQLLKIGEIKGKISIITSEGKSYITEIYRTSSGYAVETIQENPLLNEGWLAIGFPPIRTMSWIQPSGPELIQENQRPMYTDLLPLISSDPDPRIDSIKQWIINLDYWSKNERVKNENNSIYSGILKEFSKILNEITQDVKIILTEVNPDNRQISVLTDDGVVPIEVVSQGTISLLGWIGILVKRLFEVYTNEDNPTKRFAIVLIDEIDAHMHPKWQQSIIGNLSTLFPNIQFIATTHSPLIVGEMPSSQIYRFQREGKEHSKIKYSKIEDSLKGWRADQVLTSSAFDLDSTRDPHTQELISEYSQLVIQDDLSEEKQLRLAKIAKILKIRLPSSGERKVAR